MRMAVNWACYLAWQYTENVAYEQANNKKEKEALIANDYLDELRELAEKADSRGG